MSEFDITIGELIQRARIEAGLSIENLSAKSNIRESLIKKIENNDFEGGTLSTYSRGHIRMISKIIGIRPELVDAAIAKYEVHYLELNPIEPILEITNTRTVNNFNKLKFTVPHLSYKSLGLVAGVVLFGMFVLPVASSFITSAHHASTSNKKNIIVKPNPTSATTNGAILANAVKGVSVTINSITGSSWVGVQDSSNTQLFSGILNKGSTQTFTDPAQLQLAIGNAGGVDLVVNGKDLGTPGGVGQVVHLTFTPQGLVTINNPITSVNG